MASHPTFPPVRKAVFPVAGMGTRFLPASKAVPKEMLPVVDKPVIQYAVEEARAAGIEEFIFITSRGKTALQDHFDHHSELYETLERRGYTERLREARSPDLPVGKYSFVMQPEPLGLGHAVWCAHQIVGDEPFAVLLPDEVFQSRKSVLAQMLGVYEQVGGNVLAVREVPAELTSRYGILDVREDLGERVLARGVVEKPSPEMAPSTLSVVGRYILQPEVFEILEQFRSGSGGEIQLTGAIADLICVFSQSLLGVRFEGRRFDCGEKAGFVAANVAFALQRPDIAARVREVLDGVADIVPRD